MIDGTQIVTGDGLTITGASNCVMRALTIGRVASGSGISITGPSATNNAIDGCWLGTDYTGAAAAASRSTKVTWAAPRERDSRPSAPKSVAVRFPLFMSA